MRSTTGLPLAVWLGVALFTEFQISEVECQTHQWKNRYSSCSVQCGEGVQFLEKFCYTTEQIPQPALLSYCASIPYTEQDVIACNTQPCDLCERTFKSLSGTITSPYFPDKYTVPKYCRLFIVLPADKRILLGFSEFVLEGLILAAYSKLTENSVCLCGTLVQITDQNTQSRSNIYCGTKQFFSWVSDSNSVLLEFLTESSYLFNRFTASYSAITAKSTCYEFRDLTAVSKGYVTSPSYPNDYANSLHCETVLHADPAHSIALTIQEFELEPSPTCDLDYVTIEDLYSRRRQLLCGTLYAASWTSDSNEVWVTFHSNANDVYKGFVIFYETVNRAPKGSQLFTDPEGIIDSPGYPVAYPPDTTAHYRIYAHPSNIIVLKFTDFHTEREDSQGQPLPIPRVRRSTLDTVQYEKGEPCSNADRIEIQDILGGTVTSYCGKLPPFTWFSQTNEVIVRFISDLDENYKGFSASYRTIGKRPSPEWELVFRAASDTETKVIGKWLDTSRGYAEFDQQAQSVYKEDSSRTFKSSKVNNWANIGIQKVKIELYKDGSIVSAFHFKNNPGAAGSIDNWFHCDNLMYSTYQDLLHVDCAGLVFSNTGGNFAITDVEGSVGQTCTAADARLWLDIQDRVANPAHPSVCAYEQSASTVAKFFYSMSSEAGLTATGTNIATADVVTIWIQRDCDEMFTNLPSHSPVSFTSDGFDQGLNYPANEYCDYYFLNGPYDRILLHFKSFTLEHQENECTKDYIEIEDLTTQRTDRFCSNQNRPLFTTDGNAAIMRFRTDSHSNFPGWSAEASSEGRNNEDCSSILTSSAGNLTNADYPAALTHFRLQGCETLLHVHIADRVTASFNQVIIDLADCPELTIMDHVSSIPIIEVSGRIYPFSWTSTSNELLVWYCTSLPYRSYLFYEGNFRTTMSPKPATCVQYLDAEFAGTFTWPLASLPTGYQNCYIVIRTHPVLNYRILLKFNNLVLHLSDCDSYIKVTDTTTQRSDTTCQTARQPFTWTSDANEVIVQFFNGPSFSHHAVDGHYSSSPRPGIDASKTFTGDMGSFTSPNYPKDYPSDLRMDYLLHGTAHEIVFVNFLDFTMELPSTTPVTASRKKRHAPYQHYLYRRQAITKTQTACEYDYIEIKDSLDTTRNAKYCGNQLPFAWISSGNEAIVTLITDGSVVKKGFKAEYIFLERPDPTVCGDIFETSTGDFASPSYPRDYPSNADCTYIILALADQHVKITFTSFNTEDDLNCDKDSVEVMDKLSQKVDRYCGDLNTPFSWTSDSNLVFVTFRSDSQMQFGGFTATYEWEERTEKTVCQYTFDEQFGEIESPRAPGPYPNLQECHYIITVQAGYGILLTFTEFTLEDPAPSSLCEFDYLQITSSVAGTAEKLCGSRTAFERLIPADQVNLTFKSDFIVFSKGFHVKYEQVDLTTQQPSCDQDFTTPSGVFTSPNYPANYPLGLECQYSITVASGHRVKITFTDFNLESHENCRFDYVQVSDVGEGISEKYCGRQQNAFSWLSETHEVLVLFHSDERTPSTGFRAQYESEPVPTQPAVVTGCGANYGIELTASAGKLTSPNYPRSYPINIECKIRIVLDADKICEIIFTEFEVENHSQCGYDFVKLTSLPDGDTLSVCGLQATPFTWQSKSHICEVMFYSDDYVPARGYRATYTAIDAPQDTSLLTTAAPTPPPAASECTQELSGLQGTFTTPNYPDKYPYNSNCLTTITVPSNYRLQIVFRTFDVEYAQDCEWDWVQITDLGTMEKTNKYCGKYDQSFTYNSVSRSVSVHFISDNLQNKKGYSAKFIATPINP